MPFAASSSHASAPAGTAARRWSARRMLRLLVRLAGLAGDVRAKARERAQAEAAMPPDARANRDPEFADAEALDQRLGAIFYRLIGLMARWQMRGFSARGRAR